MTSLDVGARRAPTPLSLFTATIPGVALAAAAAGAAFGLRELPGLSWLSPMILAVLLGIAVNSLLGGSLAWAKPGLAFSLRRLLRFAIILLGLQLTAAQIAEVGVSGVAVLAATLLATFMFTIWMGKAIGVDPKLAQLIAAGTSICGASAVVATNTVTRGSEEDVAYAVACVTLFGTLAMLSFPLAGSLLELAPRSYGLWVGASVHEVAQVVAAAFQGGGEAGEVGTVAKLTRVMLLAPVVMSLGFLASRGRSSGSGTGARVPAPWFVLGFVLMVALNSAVVIPAEAKGWIVWATGFMLAMALAAVGLATDLRKLRARGWRPLLLGLAAFLFIAGVGLLLVTTVA